MHNHHQFCQAIAAVSGYQASNYQFNQSHPAANQQQMETPNQNSPSQYQWAIAQHHHNQQQQHQQHHQQQQNGQQEIDNHQHLYNQQHQQQHQQMQHHYQQHSKNYAVINGFRYQHNLEQAPGQLPVSSQYAEHCDTSSVVAAAAVAAAANSFTDHYHQQDHQNRPQHHQLQQPDNNQLTHLHYNSATSQFTSNSSSPTSLHKQSAELSAQSSAISQLQAFALTTPEAAAAAAAAVAFTPYYHTTPTATAANSTTVNGASHLPQHPAISSSYNPINVTKLTEKAAKGAKKGSSTPRNRQTNSKKQQHADSNGPVGSQQATVSRSQRRYAGRASCDCPNCLDLEQQRRLNAGSDEANGAGENNGLEQAAKKLKHICHHAGCGKDYEKTSHLRAHLRWHTSERLSACRHPDCGKRFTRTDELRKHMKTHHSQPQNLNKPTGTQSQHVVAAANRN